MRGLRAKDSWSEALPSAAVYTPPKDSLFNFLPSMHRNIPQVITRSKEKPSKTVKYITGTIIHLKYGIHIYKK